MKNFKIKCEGLSLKKTIILFVVLLLITISLVSARESVEKYQRPDVRDDFCGVHMNYQYCKCAFHDDYCEAVNMKSYDARIYVMREYNAWWKEQAESWGRSCIANDGIWNRPSLSCITCDVGFQKEQGRCVVNHASEDIAERFGLPTEFRQDEVRNVTYKGRISSADGEVFLWSHTFQKWIIARAGQPIYTGDILLTTGRGEAAITLNTYIGEYTSRVAPETKVNFPDDSPIPDEPIYIDVYHGAVEIYNAISEKVAEEFDDGAKLTPNPFNVRIGPTVVVGVRGTDVILAYDEEKEEANVVLIKGLVDVFTTTNPEDKMTLHPADKVTVTGNVVENVRTFERFNSELETYNLPTTKFTTPQKDLLALPATPINPDAVYPTEVSYYGDFVEDYEEKSSNWWVWVLIIVLVGGGVSMYINGKTLFPWLYS